MMGTPAYPDISGPTPEGLPAVSDIGALLRSRTQDSNDVELGTFTDDTRPTDVAVERLIAQASSVVFGATGDLTTLECQGMESTIQESAKYLISLLAACLVELSYFPEQVRSDRSAFQGYYDIFTGPMGMTALLDSVAECRGGEVVPDGEGVPGSASWAFPEDLGGLVGWQTKW